MSGKQAKAKEESTCIEEPSAEPRVTGESYVQHLGIPASPDMRFRERSKGEFGVGVRIGVLILLGAVVCNRLIPAQSTADSSINFTSEAETDDKKEKKEIPSIFIFTYLSREKAQLGKWLVVTRNLVNIDKRLTKYKIGQVVAIIDHDRDGVIIEIFIEEFDSFNPLKQYISPFKELSILSTLKMEFKLFSESNRFFSLLKVSNVF